MTFALRTRTTFTFSSALTSFPIGKPAEVARAVYTVPRRKSLRVMTLFFFMVVSLLTFSSWPELILLLSLCWGRQKRPSHTPDRLGQSPISCSQFVLPL